MLETCYIAVIISILLCHGPQASKARPSDLDTSVFSLDYDYDSEPYLPTSLGLKEAKMVDPWTLDFRHKLASRENIGKSHLANEATNDASSLRPNIQIFHTIRKVKFLSKNSILTKPQHFHEFFTQNFFGNFSREIKVVNS